MATPVVMPKLGNSVESSIIVGWKKRPGDVVSAGETLLEVETDKATVDVEAPASGTLLAVYFNAGDDVPVMTTIAAIGQPGESTADVAPGGTSEGLNREDAEDAKGVAVGTPFMASAAPVSAPAAVSSGTTHRSSPTRGGGAPISPRARHLAEDKGVSLAGIAGTGPGGRIIERDIVAALAQQPKLTPVAERMVAQGAFAVPEGAAGKKITTRDLIPSAGLAPMPMMSASAAPAPSATQSEAQVIPLKGVRKVIATRMLASLQTTAQLTLNAYADARAIRALRARLKASDERLGLRGITINDFVLYAVARTLPAFPDMNTHLKDDALYQYSYVHLGFAVDTPKGLMVPVVKNAHTMSLRTLSAEAARLAKAAQEGSIKPDELDGGTFTISNLGGFGIDTFTPVLNPPQVGILGVGGIALRAVEVGDEIQHIPHIALSLTIDHRAVDGAPGARFLQAVARALNDIDVLMAI
jgi:pyruvate dehydrogenase E2 component (dihydrolipoamide acetyltransferase)